MKTFFLRRNVYLLVTVIVILAGLLGLVLFEGSARAIASSVVASGFVSLFYMYAQYVEEDGRLRVKTFDEAGLRSLSPTRRADYSALVKRAKLNVDVLGFSLRSFTDDHASELIRKRPPFSARILVVEPGSAASQSQEELEGQRSGAFADGIDRMRKLFEDGGSAVKIRTIGHAPPSMMFRIDDGLFVGPFFSHAPSAATLTLELTATGWLFDEYMAEFDTLWNESEPLS
jgi:hypothetical protein